VTRVPPTSSEHPATWKFDLAVYHPPDLSAWRAWLAAHHDTSRGVWVASWRKASGREPVAYENGNSRPLRPEREIAHTTRSNAMRDAPLDAEFANVGASYSEYSNSGK
jgi:hypothetical protein